MIMNSFIVVKNRFTAFYVNMQFSGDFCLEVGVLD